MSNWTDFRDSVVDALKFDTVTEDMKTALLRWLLETAMPIAKTAADNFISQIREQGKTESGWCKVRDLVVLPGVIQAGLWLADKVLTVILEKTTA